MKTLKVIFLFIITFFAIVLNAQITIEGTVTDSDSNPISNALVEIIDQDDTTNNYSSTTDAYGYFTISNIFTDLQERKNFIPGDFIVLRNYPNPFNPSTIIYYELPKSERIEIKIYDILGREVRTLFDGVHKAGTYTQYWNGRNNWNSPVAAGVYFCRLKTQDNFKVNKMVLLDGGSISPSTTNARLNKIKPQSLSKANSVFNYSIKVSGDNILETKFNYLSCSSDTTLNLMVPKILQSVTIGPEGGILENEDFSISIPEGAFSEETELKLGIDQNFAPNLGTRITNLYRVQGIPYFYFAPLKIMIKHNYEFQDSLTIASGTTSTDPTTNIEEINFNYFNAKDSLGYIVSYLPTRDSNSFTQFFKRNKISKATYLGFYIFAGLAGVKDYVTKHFAASFDKIEFLTSVPILLENFEDIFAWFNNLLSLKEEEVTKKIRRRNIEVDFVKNNKNSAARPNRYLYFTRGSWRFNEKMIPTSEFNIHIYEDKFNTDNLNIIKRDQAHYFYMFYPFKYFTKHISPGNFIENYKLSTQFWLHHSIASWSEEYFPQVNNFAPLDFNLHYKEPFNGIQSFLETSPSFLEGHGIGMSALIKHFTNSYGNNIVGKFFNGLKTNSNALEIIIDTLTYTYNTSESIWWPNFFKEYIQGNIYNVSGEEFLKNVSETIEFNDGDTLKYADETYNDLSAKLFKIKINSEEIKTKTLNFKIDSNGINVDYVKTLVFGLSNNNLTYLAEGVDFNVSYFHGYDALLACVVNSGNEPPYTGTSNINLDIKVTDDLAFRHCDINLAVVAMHDTLEEVWSPGWYTDGVFKDNVFIGTINKERQGGNATGSIRVEVDDNQNIIYLDVMAYHNDPTGFSSQWGFTAKNIPPTENEPYLLVYSYSGNSVCNYVKSIYAKYIEVDGDETEIKNFKCDDESVLHIKFHNWD